MRLKITFKAFLKDRAQANQSLILGLSGGVDSLCLFYLLRENCSFYSTLHIAHVDHGWRKESAAEAATLEELARRHGLPFHLHVIDKRRLKGNLEDACRNERMRFFLDLAKHFKAQAIVLGHHADDQAETVLKRLLEGSSCMSAYGMRSAVQREGVPIWRPLLQSPKSDIVSAMAEHGRKWIEDPTNDDQNFLRARMRRSLIPLLSEEFGKNILSPLCRIGSELEEIADYLAFVTKSYQPRKMTGPFGVCYDFSKSSPDQLIEWKFLIKNCCQNEDFPINHEKLNAAALLLSSGAANKKIGCGAKVLTIDRKKIFFLVEKPLGSWKIEMGRRIYDYTPDWTQVFQGEAGIALPEGSYRLASAKNSLVYQGSKTLGSWWSKNKIPVCVRDLAPVLVGQDQTIYELLTGKAKPMGQKKQSALLKFKKLC